MPINIIRRADLRPILDEITKDPERIFSVLCRRRTAVYLRYDPPDMTTEGKLAYRGDHSLIATRQFIGGKRGSEKIELQPAGSVRTMLCKRKFPGDDGRHTEMKHWIPKGGECRVKAEDHNLFGPVAGMYNDQEKTQPNGEVRQGRFGQWRPWSFIALEGVVEVHNKGEIYQISD